MQDLIAHAAMPSSSGSDLSLARSQLLRWGALSGQRRCCLAVDTVMPGR